MTAEILTEATASSEAVNRFVSGGRLELSLVPRLELRSDGVPISLAPASERLLAFLALQPGLVRREQACAALWPDLDERHAAGGLRTALWRVRRIGIVSASRTHLRLTQEIAVDVRQLSFESLSVIRGERSIDQLVDTAERLISAEGGILADYVDDWVIHDRERFRQIWLQAMDEIGEHFLDAGFHGRAVHVASVASQAEPLRESAHRILIRAHAMQGNIAEAVREYRQYAGRLKSELDVRPSRMMRELVASCLAEATA